MMENVNAREQWANKLDFLFSVLAYAVGYGNVWRFPYMCYKNGGGAFLIPYFICVFLGGIPMMFMEMSLGQYSKGGGLKAWQTICPLMKGIGAAAALMIALNHVYYIVIMAWVIFYMFASFTSELPWTTCNNDWNTERCRDDISRNATNFNSSIETTKYIQNQNFPQNTSYPMNTTNTSYFSDPTTEFWNNRVLKISNGVDHVGLPNWDLSLCLLLCWLIVYFCVLKGIKTSGKIMYGIFIVPYILMTILLVRGMTLPGAIEGVKYYMIPSITKLKDPMVWVDAGTQVFFSYSLSMGVITALGSYNSFHHNCMKDCLITSAANSATSIFAGFSIFSVLGFMAKQQGLTVDEVAESGPGLAFIAYPKAVSLMPVSPLWSVLFFLMLFLLGLGSQIGGIESIAVAIIDQYPDMLRKGHRRHIVVTVLCLVMFALGITNVTPGGIYVFQLFDYFASSRFVMVSGFLQCITIGYIYGVNKYYSNLKEMLGFNIGPYMKVCWLVLSPLYTACLFAMSIYSYSEVNYNRHYKYPQYAVVIGWLMAVVSIILIPAFAISGLLTTRGTFKQRLRQLLTPLPKTMTSELKMGHLESKQEEQKTFLTDPSI